MGRNGPPPQRAQIDSSLFCEYCGRRAGINKTCDGCGASTKQLPWTLLNKYGSGVIPFPMMTGNGSGIAFRVAAPTMPHNR